MLLCYLSVINGDAVIFFCIFITFTHFCLLTQETDQFLLLWCKGMIWVNVAALLKIIEVILTCCFFALHFSVFLSTQTEDENVSPRDRTLICLTFHFYLVCGTETQHGYYMWDHSARQEILLLLFGFWLRQRFAHSARSVWNICFTRGSHIVYLMSPRIT